MFNKHELATYLAQGEAAAYTHNKSAEAWSYIRSHPATFAAMTLRRIYRFWSGTGKIDASPTYEIHAVTTTLLRFIGLAFLYRRSRSVAALFALPLLLFPLPYYITHAEFRYRLNIKPLLYAARKPSPSPRSSQPSQRVAHIPPRPPVRHSLHRFLSNAHAKELNLGLSRTTRIKSKESL